MKWCLCKLKQCCKCCLLCSGAAGEDGMSDLGIATLRSWPILFHATHSTNIRLSHDRRRAKRVDGIKGVCFSSRPVCIGERIYVRIADASNMRNGALRFGFTTDDPCTIDESDLPRLYSLVFLRSTALFNTVTFCLFF